jgi:hypothetical protein
MRRIATATLAAGIAITAFSLTAVPADAAAGFWRTVGLSGVDAFGFYNVQSTKVTLNFDLKDTKKDGYSAALRFTFTGTKKQKDDVQVVALQGDRLQDKWQTVTSTRLKHMYVQECRGTWKKSKFTKKCAGWRQHY